MENENHIELLKKGTKYWNSWREEKKEIPFLKEANLAGVDLSGANLIDANLIGASLIRAKLIGANLIGANLTGANFYKANLIEARFIGANLTKVNFNCADLTRARLTESNLNNANFTDADLTRANLNWANLTDAKLINTKLFEAKLTEAKLIRADLNKADLSGAKLVRTKLTGANLTGANLNGANLNMADLIDADLTKSSLIGVNLYRTDLTRAILTRADLTRANCIETIFKNSIIENACIYGISTWNIQIEGLKQNNLIITKPNEPVITVDNIEVAQFIYLILNNSKIRDVIGTIAKKGVLILGRFTPERKRVLDIIRDKLREHDFVPIMFDFEKVSSRDFTETIKILAGMSRFVIADITSPKSSPLELQAAVPDYKIPFLPIIQKGEQPFSMFLDLQQKYNWVLELLEYDSESELTEGFQKGILDRALEADKRLFYEKQDSQPKTLDINNFK